jgi:N4-gp56 family major capsid protein
MSSTAISSSHALAQKNWLNKVFREYVDKIVLSPYMGTNSESVINVMDIFGKMKGDRVTVPLAYALRNDGVVSGGTMEGQEEAMNFYGFNLTLEEYRNAVKDDGTLSRQRTAFELMQEFEPALTTWMAQKVENKLFEALHSIDGVVYGSATAAQKNTWNTENTDRILFGAAVANYSATHSTALATVDGTTDILNVAQISLAKRLAQLANPKVRPVKIDNGEEYYVMFVHPLCARDLKNSTPWQEAQKWAMPRGSDNPIFTGMLGVWDGVILKESPKVLLLHNVGTGGTVDVAMNSLCGAQALGFAQADYPENGGAKVVLTEKKFDYDNQMGVQIKSTFAHGKCVFNSKQHGVVSVFSAAVAD